VAKTTSLIGSNKVQSCQLIKKINISRLMRFG